MKARRQGFTLIELLLVIAVLALLMTITMAAMGPIIRNTKRMTCASQLSAVLTSYLAYANEFSGRCPPLCHPREYNFTPDAAGYDDTWLHPEDNYFITTKEAGWSAGFGPLLAQGLLKAEYLVCPAACDSPELWWSGSQRDIEAEYWWQGLKNPDPSVQLRGEKTGLRGTPEPSFASYSIRHKLYPWTITQVAGPLPGIPGHGRRAILADNLCTLRMVAEGHGTGVNVAYIDGSVDFREGGQFMNTLRNAATSPTGVPDMDTVWRTLD